MVVLLAYKRYIHKKGKQHGPYYYKNVRDSAGRVRSVYLGKVTSRGKKPLEVAIVFLMLLLIIISSLFFIQNRSLVLSKIVAEESAVPFEIDQILIKVLVKANEYVEKELRVMNVGDGEKNVNIDVSGISGIVNVLDKSFPIKPGQTKIVRTNISSFNKAEGIEQSPGVYIGKIIAKSDSYKREVPVIVEVESKNVLFDMNLNPVARDRSVLQGGSITFEVRVFNLQSIESSNVDMDFFVKDINGNTIISERESVVVTTQASFFKTLKVPENLKTGNYVFAAEATFGKSVGTSSYLFEVEEIKKETGRFAGFIGFCRNDPLCWSLSLVVLLLIFTIGAYAYFFVGAFIYKKIFGIKSVKAKETGAEAQLIAEEKKENSALRFFSEWGSRKRKGKELRLKRKLEIEKEKLKLEEEKEKLMIMSREEEAGRKGLSGICRSLIGKGYRALDKDNIGKADSIYIKIIGTYTALPNERKAEVFKEINLFYKSLLLKKQQVREKEKQEDKSEERLAKLREEKGKERKKKVFEFLHNLGLAKTEKEKREIEGQKEERRKQKELEVKRREEEGRKIKDEIRRQKELRLAQEEERARQREIERQKAIEERKRLGEEEAEQIAIGRKRDLEGERKRAEEERQRQKEIEAKNKERERRRQEELKQKEVEKKERIREEQRKSEEKERKKKEDEKNKKLSEIKELESGITEKESRITRLKEKIKEAVSAKNNLANEILGIEKNIEGLENEKQILFKAYNESLEARESIAKEYESRLAEWKERHNAKLKEKEGVREGVREEYENEIKELESEIKSLSAKDRAEQEKWRKLELKAKYKLEEKGRERAAEEEIKNLLAERKEIEKEYSDKKGAGKPSISRDVMQKQKDANDHIREHEREIEELKKEIGNKEKSLERFRDNIEKLEEEKAREKERLIDKKKEIGGFIYLSSFFKFKPKKTDGKKEDLGKKIPKEEAQKEIFAEAEDEAAKQEIEELEKEEVKAEEEKKKGKYKGGRGKAGEEQKKERKQKVFGFLHNLGLAKTEKEKSEIERQKEERRKQKEMEARRRWEEKRQREIERQKAIEEKRKQEEKANQEELNAEVEIKRKREGKSRLFVKCHKLLLKANKAIESNDIAKAKKLYLKTRDTYIRLEYLEKKEIYGELTELYNKLSRAVK